MGCTEKKVQRLKRLLHILKLSIIFLVGLALSEFWSEMAYFPHYLSPSAGESFVLPFVRGFVVWFFLVLAQSHYTGNVIKSIPSFQEHHVILSEELCSGG